VTVNMTGRLPAKVHALQFATENLFEMQDNLFEMQDTTPTAQGPKVVASPLDVDVRHDRMESILLSLMDTFDAGNGTNAATPQSDVCHDDLSSWQSRKCDGDGFGSQDLTGVSVAIPQLAVCHVDLISWQCHADLSSWQSRKCDGDAFGSQDLTGVAGLELEHSFNQDIPALWHHHKEECLESAYATQKKEASVPQDPYMYSKGPLAPTADTLPTVAMTRTLEAIPTQDLLSLTSVQELYQEKRGQRGTHVSLT